MPIHTYQTHVDGCSIIGGYVYRGDALPALKGTYFFGDWCSGKIWSLKYDGSNVSDFQERTSEMAPDSGSISQISSFAEDSAGELYILDHSDGEIYQIVHDVDVPSLSLGGVVLLAVLLILTTLYFKHNRAMDRS